jgi:hypothetical protein
LKPAKQNMALFTGNAEQVTGFVPPEKILRVGVFVACRLAGAEPPAFLPLSARRTIRDVERSLGRSKTSRLRDAASRDASHKT